MVYWSFAKLPINNFNISVGKVDVHTHTHNKNEALISGGDRPLKNPIVFSIMKCFLLCRKITQ